PMLKQRLYTALMAVRKYAVEFARAGVQWGHDVYEVASAAQMLAACDLIDMRNIFDVVGIVVDTEAELSADVAANHPSIAAKKDSMASKSNREIRRGPIGERKTNMEALMTLLAYQSKATDNAANAIPGQAAAPPPQPRRQAEAAPAAPSIGSTAVPDVNAVEFVKTLSVIPNVITLANGQQWLLIDQIELLDREVEEKHAFAVNDAKDTYRTNQKQKYPDGTEVEDRGRAHVGGYATYKILNVTPGKPVMIIRRMDYVYGDYELEIFANNKPVS